jgi:peptide/nickel transport system substrate-binding protein
VAQEVEGVPDGTLLEFFYSTIDSAQQEAAATVLQASLAQCGIRVNLDFWGRPEFLAEGAEAPVFGRRFDIAQFAWVAGVEPRCDLYLCSEVSSEENGWAGLNASGFCNEEYDAACTAALQLLPGQPGYEQFHMQAQQIFAEQLPVVPLYARLKTAATRPDLKGFIMDPTESEMWNIEAFDY